MLRATYTTNAHSFRQNHSSKMKSVSKRHGFQILWAVTLAGIKYRRSEITLEKPSKPPLPLKIHKITVDRSKGLEMKTVLQKHYDGWNI